MTACESYKDMFSGCTALIGLKIKNAPRNFDASTAGLQASQYTIISYRD